MQYQDALQRKLPERIFHAVCFEGIATAILAPTAAWLMQRSVVEMGGSPLFWRPRQCSGTLSITLASTVSGPSSG